MAEVLTPQGHTIRLPAYPDASSRGFAVQFNQSCKPTGISLPTPNTGGFTDVLQPRRTTTPLPSLIPPPGNRLFYHTRLLEYWLTNYTNFDEPDAKVYNPLSYRDGFYLPFLSVYPHLSYARSEDGGITWEIIPQEFTATDLYCFFDGSFDQSSSIYQYIEDRDVDKYSEAEVVPMRNIYVLDIQAEEFNYRENSEISKVYEDLQANHPGCKLFTYKETENRGLPEEREIELLDAWMLDPLDFPYTEYKI